jgi:hypothetical protein
MLCPLALVVARKRTDWRGGVVLIAVTGTVLHVVHVKHPLLLVEDQGWAFRATVVKIYSVDVMSVVGNLLPYHFY